jgi:hypothetical protein
MVDAYEAWLDQVRDALRSINMPMEDWQGVWPFDFSCEHNAGTMPDEVARKANRYWWHQQNKSLNQDCQKVPNCWLPRDHQGKCQPVYERGDYVKVEFPDEVTGVGEWMWVRVSHSDDERQLVFGVLDNEPINDYKNRLHLGSELAASYSKIREHRKSGEFRQR